MPRSDRNGVIPTSNQSILVRRHERAACRLDAELSCHALCATQVRLSRAAGSGHGTVRAMVIDLGSGGMGINSPVYFPKGSTIHVVIGPAGGPVLLEADLEVRRVEMTGREPLFELGTCFHGAGAALAERVGRVIEQLNSEAGSAAGN
jgi:hypothetical protein